MSSDVKPIKLPIFDAMDIAEAVATQTDIPKPEPSPWAAKYGLGGERR